MRQSGASRSSGEASFGAPLAGLMCADPLMVAVDSRSRVALRFAAALLVLAGTLSWALPLSAASASGTSRFSDRLELTRTSVTAGQEIKGWLVVENRGRTVNLTTVKFPSNPWGCRPKVGVGLSNAHYQQDVNFTLECSARPFEIFNGETRIPVTLVTTYPNCAQPGGGPITATNPACIGSSQIPPMPPGKYETQVRWSERVLIPNPKSVAVTVKPAS